MIERAAFRSNPIIAGAKVDQTVSPKTFFVVDLEKVVSFAKVESDFAVVGCSFLTSKTIVSIEPLSVEFSWSRCGDFCCGKTIVAMFKR